MKIYFLIIGISTMYACLSCNNEQKRVNEGKNDCHTTIIDDNCNPKYYDFVGHPESEFDYYSEFSFSIDDIIRAMNPVDVENIKLYVDEIIADGSFVIDRYNKENTIIAIRDLANKLQLYKDNRKRYFPDKELKEILTNMLGEIAYLDNHRPGILPREFIIFPRLLEIAASLCPNVSIMASYTSTDKNIGVVTIEPSCYSGYEYTVLITKAGDGCRIHYLPQVVCKINKIRHIGSSEHSEEYLLSYEDKHLCPFPSTSIYLVSLYSDGDASIYDLSANSNFKEWSDFIYDNEDADKCQVYFNPKEICWLWCKKNKFGNLEKFEGSKTLFVDLESYCLRVE